LLLVNGSIWKGPLNVDELFGKKESIGEQLLFVKDT
jgi:hypothetical protein